MDDDPGYPPDGPREMDVRREGWALGQVVRLSDGRFWALPPISPDFVGQWGDIDVFAAQLAESDRRATMPDFDPETDTIERDCAIRGIALRLVHSNYRLATDQVIALMPEDPVDAAHLDMAVRALLDEARPIVMGFATRVAFALTSPN